MEDHDVGASHSDGVGGVQEYLDDDLQALSLLVVVHGVFPRELQVSSDQAASVELQLSGHLALAEDDVEVKEVVLVLLQCFISSLVDFFSASEVSLQISLLHS